MLQIRDLIRALKTANTAVLVSSHILNEVEALCDRVIMLDSGKKTVDVAMNDFIATGNLKLIVNAFPYELRASIESRGDVESVNFSKQSENRLQIAIKLQKESDLDKTMASIIECIVRRKIEIYAANPEQRGLEYIFNRSEKGELSSVG